MRACTLSDEHSSACSPVEGYLVAVCVRILKVPFVNCGRCYALASSESFVYCVACNGVLELCSHKCSTFPRLDMEMFCTVSKLSA